MLYIDTKAQMMDAGMAMFASDDNFGCAIGQMKAELETYGKVWRRQELEGTELPESTGDYDLFVDYSNFWRSRYLACKIESAGEGRYAVSMKEGNRSRTPRAFVHAIIIGYGFLMLLGIIGLHPIGLTASPSLASTAIRIAGAALMLIGAISWITPSCKSRRIVSDFLAKFSL